MHIYLTTAVLALLCASAQAYDYLTATALVTNAANESALECWRFATPLIDSSEPGIAGSLRFNFNASSASYTIIPPRFNGSTHNSPTPQVMLGLKDLSAVLMLMSIACCVHVWTGTYLAALFQGSSVVHRRKSGCPCCG